MVPPTLSHYFKALVHEFRDSSNLDSEFDRQVIRAYEMAVFRSYQSRIASLTEMGFRLGLNPGTIEKWVKGAQYPSLSHVVWAFLAFDIDFREREFPRGRIMNSDAVCETLLFIRSRGLCLPVQAKLERCHLILLATASSHEGYVTAMLAGETHLIHSASQEIWTNANLVVDNALGEFRSRTLSELFSDWFASMLLF